MLTFIARMTVRPDRQGDFITIVQELRDLVHKHEPRTLMYEFYRGEKQNEYIVLESFTDEEAEHAHQATDYFKRIVPGLLDCLDGTYVREYFHPLSVFESAEPAAGKR